MISQLELMGNVNPNLLLSISTPNSYPAIHTSDDKKEKEKGRGDRTITNDEDAATTGGVDGDGDGERGLHEIELTYFLGEESELWREVFGPLKRGELS